LLLVPLPPSLADSRRGSSSRLESPEERQQRAKRLQTQCLNELSLKQLKAWIEEDEEKKTNKVRRPFVQVCVCPCFSCTAVHSIDVCLLGLRVPCVCRCDDSVLCSANVVAFDVFDLGANRPILPLASVSLP
jgi:hypothetical protein